MAVFRVSFARSIGKKSTWLESSLFQQSKLASKPQSRLMATIKPPEGPPPGVRPKGTNWMLLSLGLSVAAAGSYYYYVSSLNPDPNSKIPKPFQTKTEPPKLDFQKVYNRIASILDASDYDDGSYAPILLRLAWHAAGTYDKTDGTGGSNGATMRYDAEAGHGGNAGLKVARDLLEPIKKEFPSISYSDLWSLAGVAAIQEMGGPIIKWRPGRKDADSASACTPDGRLPDATKSHDHIRNIFYRMGFNDQEIVALIGAHAVGRCHTDRSGFDGPWTRSPITFSNDFYKRLLEEKWVPKKWKGPNQMVDKSTGELMMLPSDMALLSDKEFKKWVEIYAKDEKRFFDDFAKAFQKLEELGVPFKEGTPVYEFKPTV